MSDKQWYFDDFVPGQEIDLGQRTVTEDEIIAFATQFDPQPFHIDREAAAKSIYGGVIASGWHTCAMMMRMVLDGMRCEEASMGSPGLDGVRWLQPVRAGDTLAALRDEGGQALDLEAGPGRGVFDLGGEQSARRAGVHD